jgi:hypothetical protein
MPGKQAKILSTDHIDDLLFFADHTRSRSAIGLSFFYPPRLVFALAKSPN